ncbi:MAG TPA: Hpt domain-containing protein [Candidatus Omnitrophota bacterium]|nr:Hpt domain-containing protein [Candidatus Omnitrophota bacterium]HPB67749.1 Hpt domain-containing protein [Candidatus Omnitrophota bacterium]HQO58142.1 Hpt domain-containing protein [Candidatus Omnitrophota bacterium]HQP11710.1 Hpt domain-containing protein [Candidatus Omnitrophota bacterium]
MGLAINVDKNCEQLKIGRDIYLRILNKAVIQTTTDIAALEKALNGEDWDTVQTLSHRLKGDYDNMRITDLSSVARTMNVMVKSGNINQAELSGLFTVLSGFFEELKQFCENTGPECR